MFMIMRLESAIRWPQPLDPYFYREDIIHDKTQQAYCFGFSSNGRAFMCFYFMFASI